MPIVQQDLLKAQPTGLPPRLAGKRSPIVRLPDLTDFAVDYQFGMFLSHAFSDAPQVPSTSARARRKFASHI